MAFLSACGRLNLVPAQANSLLEAIGPCARARQDLQRLTALAQLAAKFGCAESGEARRILLVVSGAFEGPLKGHASQAVHGQLLLALIFDEKPCEVRDRGLVASVKAVRASFGTVLEALDERLAKQLQVVHLACRLERPKVLQIFESKGLMEFLEGLEHAERPHK